MTAHELVKLVDKCEEKHGDYVYIKLYGDGSGGLYSDGDATVTENDVDELITWDSENEIENAMREWIKG